MRLLLVEDESRLADATARGLRAHAHVVDVAPTLTEARRRLAAEDPEVVLLDVGMPDGSGLDWLREIRAAGNAVAVIVLTARDGLEDRVTGLDEGADDYLVKPFALEELEARLRALARRTPAWHPHELVVDTLEVDPVARRARRGSREVELTATEFALLEYLALHPGVVLSRARISATVWDEDYDPASNLIDVYVARLRRKIDGPDDRPLLHTVRGTGYVLDPDRAT